MQKIKKVDILLLTKARRSDIIETSFFQKRYFRALGSRKEGICYDEYEYANRRQRLSVQIDRLFRDVYVCDRKRDEPYERYE